MVENRGEAWNFFAAFWRLAEEVVAIGLLYNIVITIINKLQLLFTGAVRKMTFSEVVAAHPVAPPLITIPLKDPIATAIILCIVTGVLLYIVLRYFCRREWVQEKVSVKKCWKKVKWYNPFSWIRAIVCTIVEVVKWALKLICRWVIGIVVILVVVCIVVSIIAVLV